MEQRRPTEAQVTMTGYGGQGVLTMGKLLGEAGMSEYKYVIHFQFPQMWMRGGEVECCVTLSNEDITAMGVISPQAAIILGAGAFSVKLLEQRVQQGGILLIDSAIVKDKVERDDLRVFYFPATKIAQDLGSRAVGNLVMLGAYLEATKALSLDSVEKALEKRLSGRMGQELLSLNKEALREGAKQLVNYSLG